VAALTDDDTVRLLEALLEHSTVATSIDHTLIAQTGGNPLYADQYARMLAERSSGGELPVPESVQGIIAARLDLLVPEEKSLLQQAAVVGKVFWLGSLVDGSSRTEVEQRLRTLERKGFVQRAGQSSVEAEPEYAFRHVLVRDVAYGQIPRGARRDNHRRAAEWIESLGRVEDHAEMLAHHYSVTLELAQATGQETYLLTQRTRLAFRCAAERAVRLNGFGAAARYYEQALELWPPDESDRAQVLLAYGKALHVAERRGHQVLRDARDALLLAGDVESAAVAEAELGSLLWEEGQAEQALRHLTEAVDLLRVRPASPAKTQVLISLARVKVFTGDTAEAARLAGEALTAAEDLALNTERADALNYRGAARFVLGDLEGGIADLEHSLELALAANNVPALLRAYNNLAGSLEGVGQMGRARDLYREGLRLAERLGNPDEISWYRGELAETLIRGGWWEEALELFESADEDGVQPAPAAIALARGDAEPALRCALSLIEGSREAGRAEGRAAVLAFYADALIGAGRREEAAAVADELAETLQEIPLTNLAWPGIAIALAQTGRSDALLSALATARPTPWAEAAAAYGSGEFVVAADLYAGLGDRFDEALARLEAARQLVGHGRRGDARTQLDKALSFFNSVAATRYIAEADELMNAPA
jgi:tetratricopeptide (TPR) repeat protein